MNRKSTTRWAVAAIAVAGVLGVPAAAAATTATPVAPPLTPLATDCSHSHLPPHDGFQEAPRCSETSFGEVSEAGKNPSLLIVEAPERIQAGHSFTIEVSTRNLVRDRFLAAAKGGYYLESSLLNDEGLQRGHFHVACRAIADDDVAPAPDAAPAFFKAVEDGRGGARPDVVEVEVPGKKADGTHTFHSGQLVQCAAWAGDGSHRIPMMQRANQTPAFDAVRLRVVGR